MGRKAVDPVIRFWRFVSVDVSPGACWEWTGGLLNGYGSFSVLDNTISAHRFAFENWKGGIPAGLNVLHKCDNRKCVRLSHLFAGTDSDNMWDKVRKGRANSPTGARPPARKPRLTPAEVAEIRARIASGATAGAVAEAFGLHKNHVRRVALRRVWADMP